ncbi:MAG: hypothetical protein IPM24_26405 [Bryobacterales bacterium]|nr:hypothetical protein [Bryobacterales bacterium]
MRLCALSGLLLIAMTTPAAVRIEKTEYKGWNNCFRVTNGEVELIVTADVGPRVIRFGFTGGQNLFKEFDEQMGRSGESEWRIRGGHRFWIAPEVAPEISPVTYAVDNFPVDIEARDGVLIATAPLEQKAGLRKQVEIRLAPSGTRVEVIHRVTNHNVWTVELAPWVLTVMAQSGVGVFGLPPRGTHPEVLAPTNPLIIWAFTDLSDPRWIFTKKYIALRQDPANSVPMKIGSFHTENWGAYLLNGEAFIKRAKGQAGKPYPDLGASYETFTNGDMLELETLGPLEMLAPGATAEHTEHWSLHKGVTVRDWTDAELDRVILPLL